MRGGVLGLRDPCDPRNWRDRCLKVDKIIPTFLDQPCQSFYPLTLISGHAVPPAFWTCHAYRCHPSPAPPLCLYLKAHSVQHSLCSSVSHPISPTHTPSRAYGESILTQHSSPYSLYIYIFFFIQSSGGWGKIKRSLSPPHSYVFSYASCVDLTQLLSQPNASWRVLRIPLKATAWAVPCILFLKGLTTRHSLSTYVAYLCWLVDHGECRHTAALLLLCQTRYLMLFSKESGLHISRRGVVADCL